MAVSRSARITLLLVIDVVFFFIELIVGYAVGSLALVADSFHMLNDVLSLIVALYAIKMSNKTEVDNRYSYGWHRAEILAALINGVFLLALCVSIFLEAIERFFSTPEIGNPKLVVIVGACGLVSNIVGLFLFHEHSHSDGHEDPSHKHIDDEITHTSLRARSPARRTAQSQAISIKRPRSGSTASTYGHPAAVRESFNQAAEEIRRVRSPSPRSSSIRRQSHTQPADTILVGGLNERDTLFITESDSASPSEDHSALETSPLLASDTRSTLPVRRQTSGAHSHGSMNMKAIMLHVLGDALGNVGVIATGLIIWLTSWPFKFYFDPIISLVITAIIFSSAMPLVRSTAFILLQGVPPAISLEEVRNAILEVKGVLSLHELHIWQLSESKVVASVHISALRDYDFMRVAAEIQEALHHHGIHSSTIQPEYHLDSARTVTNMSASSESPQVSSGCSSCLINCPRDMRCSSENTCCPPLTGV